MRSVPKRDSVGSTSIIEGVHWRRTRRYSVSVLTSLPLIATSATLLA